MANYILLVCSCVCLATSVGIYRLPELWLHFVATGLLSFVGFLLTMYTIPRAEQIFIARNLVGVDMCKKSRKSIPEAVGSLAGVNFLIVMSLMLPIPFLQISGDYLVIWDWIRIPYFNLAATTFNGSQFISMLAAIYSISCMIILGFVDDFSNLRWLFKLLVPTIATSPLLLVYAITYNETWIMLPKPFHFSINLGIFYYIYMSMMAVFCTNAINIYAGINGIEVGQSLVVACSLLIFDLVELSDSQWRMHLFSFTFILPFICVSMALFHFNSYPAKVFVGDTYCYFAGMTFAVVGILGHFSKTTLLFFIPQIFNFLFSCPQLFHFVPCPRHRLPRYDSATDCLNNSTFDYDSKKTSKLGKFCLFIAKTFKLSKEVKVSKTKSQFTNFTLINLMILWLGPMNEKNLVRILLSLQILSSAFAFFIRYHVVKYFY
ncbi:alg7 dolichyl-phosphate N-acetylglucosaminephosphotransferase [Brevipalpus obovatus]|uniref:alg7 dolichyl-phosphate N-acetylglucosaminephosphotransferase n=1 Tax=Brevipalpus obovatus TaxID=246614 RepID=UPI003D9EB74B